MEESADLVDPGMFLRGCEEPLEQYRDCLMKNLKDWNGRGLHRGKLAEVKIHQLCQMNITRFDHQKLIMDRIRRLPEIPSMPRYNSDEQKVEEVEAAVHVAPEAGRNSGQARQISTASAHSSAGDSTEDSSTADGRRSRSRRGAASRHGIGVKGGRRGSLATEKSWGAINKSRAHTEGGIKQRQLSNLRRRKSTVGLPSAEPKPFNPADYTRDQDQDEETSALSLRQASIESAATKCQRASGSRRALSLHNPDKNRQAQIEAAKTKRQRAMEYGNSALKTMTREGHLKELKKQILADFVNTIGCERATLMLVDTPAQELFFFDGDSRIAFSLSKGIAGRCATSGLGEIVNDPYNHEYFNRQIDKDSGFMTRNILCEPIKSRRGGNVVAVLQMVNKLGGQDFTEQDAGVIEICAVKVAIALDASFSALVEAENEWAKTAGRRGSSRVGDDDGRGGSLLAAAAATSDAAASAITAGEKAAAHQQADGNPRESRRSSTLDGRRRSNFKASRASSAFDSSQEISNRRGSGASKEDSEKLKRRTEYGKEVRDSSVGLL